jgi:hypothetical protein
MTYFATKQKIDESRFSRLSEKFYCKGPEHFVRFLDLSDDEAIPGFPATDNTEGPIYDVQEDLRKEVGKGCEVHIYKTSIPENEFDFSRVWDYVVNKQAELLVY